MKVFFGWALMAAGALIALTCGLATFGLAAMCGGPGAWSVGSSGLATIVIIGAVPTLFGVAVFIAGLLLVRESRRTRANGGGA